jgi:hypothetical protein
VRDEVENASVTYEGVRGSTAVWREEPKEKETDKEK